MRSILTSVAGCCLIAAFSFTAFATAHDDDDDGPRSGGTLLPTGKRITPLAAPGATLESLNPEIKILPAYRAGQAISTAVSPDKKTLLVLTSGFNRMHDAAGNAIPEASNEFIFVYDITSRKPVKTQVVAIPNSFAGIAFSPGGKSFFVSGGVDDNLHEYAQDTNGKWAESGEPVKLAHTSGLGFSKDKNPLAAGGVAVSGDGKYVVVANVYNDSVSVVDVAAHRVTSELDLRPGKIDRARSGEPGGEYPFWVAIKGNDVAYVSSLRDREIVVVRFSGNPVVTARIKVKGNPNKMILNRDQSRLFVTSDNSDSVTEIDTASNKVRAEIPTAMPSSDFSRWTGNDPDDLAFSSDERTLYVSNGGTNSVAVLHGGGSGTWRVAGLIPTGWYPTALGVSADDRTLYVVNSKTNAGPNPDLHQKVTTGKPVKPGPDQELQSANEYVYQLEKAGLLTVPVPREPSLAHLSEVVVENNGPLAKPDARDQMTMKALHGRIHHVIYIIKENRTYDQVLGDLGRGNGDPKLAEFGARLTPNYHSIAKQFVDLDNFYNSGEVSGDGWPWSTSGRESDFGMKAVPLNYAGRGTNYEYEGLNRDINVGLGSLPERKAANPKTPDDPDLLPGTANVSEPDGPAGTPKGKGYIWDAVLRRGLTFREYGCMSDTNFDAPRELHPFATRTVVSRPANPELYKFGDPYFRGFDPGYPDFYREAEWEREFDDYVKNRDLPAFEIVQLPVDHMGEFKTAISRVNTPETQQADNDYAAARLIEHLAHSPYAKDTLVFIVEDDAQDGPDHVDAHRSTAYIVGPYVKQGAVVSRYYTTVSLLRTMEDVLGLEHLNLNTATTRPMTDVFDLKQANWTFTATPSSILLKTDLPIPDSARKAAQASLPASSTHDAEYWAEKTRGFDFSKEDRVDADLFNRIVWEGIMKDPYPSRE